ncbi:MAG TPA: hypothetical protein VML19_01290 [Verrucomicrobiae bacterium]|nr:hypothetical protein [Verrucomicrobiae bacterium]
MKSAPILVSLALSATAIFAQSSGPSATPGSLSFSYQINSSTFPAAAKVTVTLPTAISSLPLSVSVSSTPQGWLTVTPSSGNAPLTLQVVVNPTSLAPGSYVGTITINTVPSSSNPAVVSANLLISNPPSVLSVTSPSSNYTAPASGTNSPTLTFAFTTGTSAAIPATSELDVSSNGGIIPFNVTAASLNKAAVFARVNTSNQLPTVQTSGVALSGSFVPITVSLDLTTLQTLNPGSYGGTVTVAATNAANGSALVNVNLVVSAGPPVLNSIFPASVVAAPAVNPVITIYGDNFFSTSVVTLQQGNNPPVTLSSTLLSRQVLQATVNVGYLASPGVWTLAVTNPAPPNNPGQAPVTTLFIVSDPTVPLITSVVNSASYLPTSVWTGTGGADPVPGGTSSVSPREIISIFGQNLGPSGVTTSSPTGSPLTFPTMLNGIQVAFTIGNGAPVYAPIIMVSANQINALVPAAVSTVLVTNNPTIAVQVINTNTTPPGVTAAFNLMVVQEDPGTFTFGGLGQGQAAVLNYDPSSGTYSINSSKNAAARGSTILIYTTGMGELALPVADGVVADAAGTLADNTVRVDIAGQPAVVSYAGSSPGAVAGLVQINAIVPPTVSAGAAVSLTVSIGAATGSRRSQPSVTIAVK